MITPLNCRRVFQKSEWCTFQLRWRLRYWCPSAQAATIIIDGDTIDIDGVRIRIVQIDTPETFGPRCENELILGLKAKKRLRELLDGGTVPRKPHGGFSDEARDCDRDVDGIAGPVRGLAGSQPKPKPDTKRTTTCMIAFEAALETFVLLAPRFLVFLCLPSCRPLKAETGVRFP